MLGEIRTMKAKEALGEYGIANKPLKEILPRYLLYIVIFISRMIYRFHFSNAWGCAIVVMIPEDGKNRSQNPRLKTLPNMFAKLTERIILSKRQELLTSRKIIPTLNSTLVRITPQSCQRSK